MIGAVFQLEMRQAGRRRRAFYLRWIYGCLLLVLIAPLFFLSKVSWSQLLTGFNVYPFFENFLTEHYVILTILTPALVGGAISDEKRRGTLQHLLTAHIRPGETILGKILAHVFQLVVLTLVGMPVFCFFAALAGDAGFAPAVIVTSLVLVFGIAACSILFSVWCRGTRDAMLCSYLLVGSAALLMRFSATLPWGPWLDALNPLRVLSLDDLSLRWGLLGEFLLGWLSLGFVCVLVASLSLRRVYLRQFQVAPRNKVRWWHGGHGRVRGNPILWREQRVEGIAPLEFLRSLPRWLGVAAVMAVSCGTLAYLLARISPATPGPGGIRPDAWALIVAGDYNELRAALSDGAADAFFWHGLAALLVLTLVVAIRASGAIIGEKEKGTWQALMLTPLTTQKIISGKHSGIFWACVPYVAGHAAVAVPIGLLLGFGAATWAVLWIVVMLLAIILGGAVGLWCSAGESSSWHSLLATLVCFYIGWLSFFFPITFVLLLFNGIIQVILAVIGFFAGYKLTIEVIDSADLVSLALCFGLAAAFWVLTHRLCASAAKRVGRADRGRDEPSMGIDYQYLYMSRDGYRRNQEKRWQTPRTDYIYEPEANAMADGKDEQAPIPFA